MRYSEKWGDSIDSAVELALADLKLTREQVTVTVLEQPSKGFFGIGSKLAKVRVEEIEPPKPEKPAKPEIAETEKRPSKKNICSKRSRSWANAPKTWWNRKNTPRRPSCRTSRKRWA